MNSHDHARSRNEFVSPGGEINDDDSGDEDGLEAEDTEAANESEAEAADADATNAVCETHAHVEAPVPTPAESMSIGRWGNPALACVQAQ